MEQSALPEVKTIKLKLPKVEVVAAGFLFVTYRSTIASKINGTRTRASLPISKLHSILVVANLLAHNDISQISLQSTAVNCSFCDKVTTLGYHLLCWRWYIYLIYQENELFQSILVPKLRGINVKYMLFHETIRYYRELYRFDNIVEVILL